jgi:hypothetical protein
MVAEAARKVAGALRDFIGRKAASGTDTSPGNPA